MADIHIQREHAFGLARARQLAQQWAQVAQNKFEMVCNVVEGPTSDTVAFTRSGVKGELRVDAHELTLDARLGFLLNAFSKTIEAEIEKNIDALLSGPVSNARGEGDQGDQGDQTLQGGEKFSAT